MFRFKAITFLVLVVAVVSFACQPETGGYSEDDYSVEDAPAATEPPLADESEPATNAPTEAPESESVIPTEPVEENDSSASSGTAEIFEMTMDNWGDVVDGSPLPVLMYFWAPSNVSSDDLRPALEEIAYEYEEQIRVVTVNLDDHAEIGYYYSIFSDGTLPTVFLIINGNQEPWLEGVSSKSEITDMLDQSLGNTTNPNPDESNSVSPPLATAPIIEITNDNYTDEVSQSSEPVLIHFWAEWVGPSRVIQPEVQEIANEYADRLKVGEINVDDYPDLVTQFGIEQIPTFVLLIDGIEYARIEGVTSKAEIAAMLDEHVP